MPRQWTRRRTLRIGSTLGLLSVVGCLGGSGSDSWDLEQPLSISAATQYSAPGCSCCERYASYLRTNITGSLFETTPDELEAIKREHEIPATFRSCHTLVLEDYVVEGHVPAGVIETLLEREPSIDGIALPGMPNGAPGMGGERDESLTVYVLGGEESGTVFAAVS